VRAESVALEPGLDGLRPDVVAVVAGRPLLVEVAVTHPCGPEKVALIRQRRLAAVEIDLFRLARDAAPEAIERAVLRSAPRRWLWNRHAEAAEIRMREEAERTAARRALAREAALDRVVRELAAAAAAPAPSPSGPVGTRLRHALGAVRGAGLGGAVGTAVAGDGCFSVPRELWQAGLVRLHVLGGVPLDPHAVPAASLRPLLRGGFAAEAPGDFSWAEIAARCPALRPPSAVVADYARALGVVGLLARGADGLWRPVRAGSARARGSRRRSSRARAPQPPKRRGGPSHEWGSQHS
jgi:hypothetical protein